MSKTNEDTRTPRGNFRGKHTPGPGFQPMNHWVVCDSCGFDIRAQDIRETWDHRMVCPADWEPRHPQDFVRSRYDDMSAKSPVRPDPAKIFIDVCDPRATSICNIAYSDLSICNGGVPQTSICNLAICDIAICNDVTTVGTSRCNQAVCDFAICNEIRLPVDWGISRQKCGNGLIGPAVPEGTFNHNTL